MLEYNGRESYNEPVKKFPSLVVTDIKHKRVHDRYLSIVRTILGFIYRNIYCFESKLLGQNVTQFTAPAHGLLQHILGLI